MISSTIKPRKPKVCKCGCGEKFIPVRQIQPTRDDFECKVRYAEKIAEKSAAIRAKREREELRRRKEALRPLKWFIRKALNAAQRFARLRDENEPCISCGAVIADEWHGGHYQSVGSSFSWRALNPRNIHKQCRQCNSRKGGNRAGYRPRLAAKEGIAMVEFLEGPQQTDKPTREELLEVAHWYKEQCDLLTAEERYRKAA